MSGTVRTVLVLLLVVAGIAGAWVVLRGWVSDSAGDLRLGDCFEVPTGDAIRDVQRRPCTELHDGEVFAVGTIRGLTAYPTLDAFDAWVNTECIAKGFAAYTGTPYDTRTDVDVGFFYPVEENWAKGDRAMVCYLSPVGGAAITGSYRAAQPASPGQSPATSGSASPGPG